MSRASTAPVAARAGDTPVSGAIEGEIVHVPLRQAAAAAAFGGLVVGAFLGSLIGALLAWLAGAALDWQRDLAFTLGIARRLLPFGDQVGLLRTVDSLWYLVVPGVAVVLALIASAFGAVLGALVAAAYNRSRRRVRIRAVPVEIAEPGRYGPAGGPTPQPPAPTSDGSTPKTARMRSGASATSGGPSATTRPPSSSTTRPK